MSELNQSREELAPGLVERVPGAVTPGLVPGERGCGRGGSCGRRGSRGRGRRGRLCWCVFSLSQSKLFR